jgi:D-3-phosphoglycerate dehydrogenase
VTAPLRGPGFAKLRELTDVVYDPWIDQSPLRIYSAEQLAERISAEAADVIVVESDSVRGPVFDLGLRAIASTRGDPNNVDIGAATAAGIPVLNTPARNADAVAEMAVALLLAATRHLVAADADVRSGNMFRDGSIPYQRFRGAEIAGGCPDSACGSSPTTRITTKRSTALTTCWPRLTSSPCTLRSPRTPRE